MHSEGDLVLSLELWRRLSVAGDLLLFSILRVTVEQPSHMRYPPGKLEKARVSNILHEWRPANPWRRLSRFGRAGRGIRARRSMVCLVLLLAGWLLPGAAAARLDLAAATVERLDNGLTVIVLEEPAFPLVSVQMLYRVGAKHEPAGATGLAHFLEHMAFRATRNFPDTGVVSSIYAAGGEWHGYTWLDQTTYFATVPRDRLELLLRIEADRMDRLLIPASDIGAERGAVLAEMHGYENDPFAVLHDYVLYLSFLAHPYRNNTIGWESDVAGISHDDLLRFYRQHYHPGNAMLAVVGDVDRAAVLRLVREHFGSLPGSAPTADPRTVEPPQRGERRIRLRGTGDRSLFKFAWRAPSVHSPDFAAFLVLQEVLAGGSGVNFRQNDWGTPARPGSPLAAAAPDIATWYPPSAQDYVFTVAGSAPDACDPAAVEAAVARAIAGLGDMLEAGGQDAQQALQRARRGVARELLFDVQTTEDAAHQLAYFGGMDALDVLTGLGGAVERVGREDVLRVLRTWLGEEQSTVGWYGLPSAPCPAAVPETEAAPPEFAADAAAVTNPTTPDRGEAKASEPAGETSGERAGPPLVGHLHNGTPVIIQRSPLSPTVLLKVVVPGEVSVAGAESRANEPAWGVTSLDFQGLRGEISGALNALHSLFRTPRSAVAVPSRAVSEDPAGRMEQQFQDLLGIAPAAADEDGPLLPLLFVVSGDVDPPAVLQELEAAFGDLPRATPRGPAPLTPVTRPELESTIDEAVAQERLGYVVRAPGPRQPGAAAWWMTLYILSHGYEGRLGKAAISRRGLVYHIDSAYHSNGVDGWVTLSTGVDPGKLPAMRELLRAELERLRAEPPTQAEIDEARRHLLGRFLSAAQSNVELADRLAREWLWFGKVLDYAELEALLAAVTRDDLLALLPDFAAGTVVAVRNREP